MQSLNDLYINLLKPFEQVLQSLLYVHDEFIFGLFVLDRVHHKIKSFQFANLCTELDVVLLHLVDFFACLIALATLCE